MSRRHIEARIATGRRVARISIAGRVAWALRELMRAGGRGVSTIASPAPRWPAYIFRLRRAGVTITTEREAHGGEFRGFHARYRLACRVHVVARQAERRAP